MTAEMREGEKSHIHLTEEDLGELKDLRVDDELTIELSVTVTKIKRCMKEDTGLAEAGPHNTLMTDEMTDSNSFIEVGLDVENGEIIKKGKSKKPKKEPKEKSIEQKASETVAGIKDWR